MNFLKRRPHLLILLALVVVSAVTVTVLMVIQAYKLETLSPREERDRTASAAGMPSGQVDCAKAKCIALTFDGSPGEPTVRLMDFLKEYKAPSSFFLEGRRIHKFPEVVRRLAADGHEMNASSMAPTATESSCSTRCTRAPCPQCPPS